MSGFTDKELQIASQLAYFNFSETAKNQAGRMLNRTLHDIFSENIDYKYLYAGSVDIIVGTRTVMEYFLEPFKKGLNNSMRENLIL
jgi:hypothetical protein